MSPPQRETERGSIYQQNPESQGLDHIPTPKGTWEPKYIFVEQDCTPKYQTKDLSQSYALLSPLKVAKVSKPMHIQVIRITTSMASCIPKTSNQHQNGNGRIKFARTLGAKALWLDGREGD